MKWQRQWQRQFLCCNFQSLFLSIDSLERLKTQLCELSTSPPANVRLTDRAGGSEALPRNKSSIAGSQTPSSSLNPLFFLREAEGAQIKTKQLDCRKWSVDCLGLTWGEKLITKRPFLWTQNVSFFLSIQELCCFKRPFLLIQNEKIPSDGQAISRASSIDFLCALALPLLTGLLRERKLQPLSSSSCFPRL